MREIKRYTIVAGDGPGLYEYEEDDGEWCVYEDVEELEQKLSDAEKQIEKLKPLKGFILISPDTCKRYEELEKQNEWISVEDNPPPKDKEVLLMLPTGDYYVGRLRRGNNREPSEMTVAYRGYCCGRFANPIKWKPITPPEVDKDKPERKTLGETKHWGDDNE